MSDLGAGIQRLDGWHRNEAEALIEVLVGGAALQESKRNEVQFSLQNQYQLAMAANRPTGMHQTLKRKERESVKLFHSISAPARTFQASGKPTLQCSLQDRDKDLAHKDPCPGDTRPVHPHCAGSRALHSIVLQSRARMGKALGHRHQPHGCQAPKQPQSQDGEGARPRARPSLSGCQPGSRRCRVVLLGSQCCFFYLPDLSIPRWSCQVCQLILVNYGYASCFSSSEALNVGS